MDLGDFYKHDRRLGPTLEFNGVDVYGRFNADVHTFTPIQGSIDNTVQRKVSRSAFDVFNFDFGAGTLEVGAYVGGANKLDMLMNVNGYIAAAQKCIIYYSEDIGFEFDANLESYSVTDAGVEWFSDVTLTFNAIRRMQLTTESSTRSSFEFENLGSVPSGVRITIVPSFGYSNATLTLNDNLDTEMVIRFPKLTKSYKFIIDGIDGKVTENGINAILNTDLISFPKVYPGINTVSINFSGTITIEYYPTFEI